VLARAAAAAGVRRLVYMSSVRAMGDTTAHEVPFRCTDPPLPQDVYGRGKLAIEGALRSAVRETCLELVILRPPVVHGPGVKGSFRALMRLVASGMPLPLAGVDNRRSLISRDNLIDIVALTCVHPAVADRVLMVRDSIDFATPELIRALAEGLGCAARLFSVPKTTFALFRCLPRVGPLVKRLTLSLQVDDRATRALLDWVPPVSAEIGLAATARAFRTQP
jgi:nucleoside-diphosphate-sugar epimerase